MPENDTMDNHGLLQLEDEDAIEFGRTNQAQNANRNVQNTIKKVGAKIDTYQAHPTFEWDAETGGDMVLLENPTEVLKQLFGSNYCFVAPKQCPPRLAQTLLVDSGVEFEVYVNDYTRWLRIGTLKEKSGDENKRSMIQSLTNLLKESDCSERTYHVFADLIPSMEKSTKWIKVQNRFLEYLGDYQLDIEESLLQQALCFRQVADSFSLNSEM